MPTIASLLERKHVGGSLHRIRLAIAPEAARTHLHHGQYIEVRHDGGHRGDEDATIPGALKGTFVLTSPPGSAEWQLIVKDGGAMADRFGTQRPGAKFLVSEANGPGFPLDRAAKRPLVLAANGSGIAALLSTAQARSTSGDAARTFVLYGVRDEQSIALRPELEELRRLGVTVVYALSRQQLDVPGVFSGYVQHVAAQQHWPLEGAMFFAAGSKPMIEGLREVAPKLGIAREDVLLNY